MSKDDALTALAERHANTITEAVYACVPKGAKLTPERVKALMKAAAGAAFEMGFNMGRDVS